MLTPKDIKLLVESFKTRAETDYDLRRLEEKMATKDDFREVLTRMDAVIKELKDFRLEQSSHIQDHRDIRDEINAVRKRILSS